MSYSFNTSINMSSRILNKFLNRELSMHGCLLTIHQVTLLSIIDENPLKTSSALARLAFMERTTFSRNASLLERNGYIGKNSLPDKKESTHDQRTKRLELTEKGTKALSAHLSILHKCEKRVLDNLRKRQIDMDRLVILLNKFIAADKDNQIY